MASSEDSALRASVEPERLSATQEGSPLGHEGVATPPVPQSEAAPPAKPTPKLCSACVFVPFVVKVVVALVFLWVPVCLSFEGRVIVCAVGSAVVIALFAVEASAVYGSMVKLSGGGPQPQSYVFPPAQTLLTSLTEAADPPLRVVASRPFQSFLLEHNDRDRSFRKVSVASRDSLRTESSTATRSSVATGSLRNERHSDGFLFSDQSPTLSPAGSGTSSGTFRPQRPPRNPLAAGRGSRREQQDVTVLFANMLGTHSAATDSLGDYVLTMQDVVLNSGAEIGFQHGDRIMMCFRKSDARQNAAAAAFAAVTVANEAKGKFQVSIGIADGKALVASASGGAMNVVGRCVTVAAALERQSKTAREFVAVVDVAMMDALGASFNLLKLRGDVYSPLGLHSVTNRPVLDEDALAAALGNDPFHMYNRAVATMDTNSKAACDLLRRVADDDATPPFLAGRAEELINKTRFKSSGLGALAESMEKLASMNDSSLLSVTGPDE